MRLKPSFNFEHHHRVLPPPENPLAAFEHSPAVLDVIDDAETRGHRDTAGNLDFSGMELIQGGLTYVINQRAVLVPVIKERTLSEKHRKPQVLGRVIAFQRIGQQKKEFYEDTRLMSVVELDVFDGEPKDGRLIAKDTYDGSGISPKERLERTKFLEKWHDGIGEFLLFIGSHGPRGLIEEREMRAKSLGYPTPAYLLRHPGNSQTSRGPISGSSWVAPRAKAPAELSPADRVDIDIPLADRENIFDQVMSSRETLSLDGNLLQGLTFMLGPNKFQITNDELLYTPTPQGPKITRVWEVREWDGSGREVKLNIDAEDYDGKKIKHQERVLRDDALQKLLEKLGNADDPYGPLFTDLHWEVPKDELKKTPAKRVGRLATAKRRLKESLPAGLARAGASKAAALSKELLGDYELAAKILGLPIPESKKKVGWVLRAIAGRKLTDSTNPNIKRDKLAAVDYEIGLAFVDALLKPAFALEQVRHIDPKHFVEPKVKAGLGLRQSKEHEDRLQEFVKSAVLGVIDEEIAPVIDKVLETLSPPKADDAVPEKLSDMPKVWRTLGRPELRPALEGLGRNLRRQIQQ